MQKASAGMTEARKTVCCGCNVASRLLPVATSYSGYPLAQVQVIATLCQCKHWLLVVG